MSIRPEALLDALFQPGDGFIELRALPSRDRRFVEPRNMRAVESFIATHKNQNLYFAVAARRDSSNGRLENCSMARALFADVDFKSVPETDARRALDAFPLPPSIVVHSGGGLHCYWVLTDPINLQEHAAAFRLLLRSLAKALGADLASAEPARVLRIPETKNYKPDYPTPPTVTIETANAFTYDLSDFEFLPVESVPGSAPVPFLNGNGRGQQQHDGNDRLKRARAYARALPGAIQGKNGDDATYQAALRMRDFNLTEAECFDVLLAEFNPRCVPEWSELGLREKIQNAYRYARGAAGKKLDEERPQPLNSGQQHRRDDGNVQAENPVQRDTGVSIEDFYGYMPMHKYIYVPGRDLWPAESVNARLSHLPLLEKPNKWIDKNHPVEQMTWAPGQPMLIRDRLISEGGWIEHSGVTCFNLYRPSQISGGNPMSASRWLDHIRRVYPADADHIIKWNAHRVQRPEQKINHALVLGGLQGIGKDTLLEPIKYAVGPWNFSEISSVQLLGRFNGFLKSVILRINEARDLGDVDRYAFYEHLKAYTAAPPDVLRCDEKNIKEYSVLNVCGVIITTNHLRDGIYLPADDRRHYVAWSGCSKDDFADDYWTSLYSWYEHGGYGHVAAYLRNLDISTFNPKAPPPKTDAFWAIVDANREPEDAELSDALDALGNPKAITLMDIVCNTSSEFSAWLKDRKNSRQIPHRMEAVGYQPVRNPAAADGLWKMGGKRQVIYVCRELAPRDRITAANELISGAGR